MRLSDVIGRTAELLGSEQEYVGLSAFAKNDVAILRQQREGGLHNFGRNRSADLIGVIQEILRPSFRGALEELAGRPVWRSRPRLGAAEAEQRHHGLRVWVEETAKISDAQLRWPQGETARANLIG